MILGNKRVFGIAVLAVAIVVAGLLVLSQYVLAGLEITP